MALSAHAVLPCETPAVLAGLEVRASGLAGLEVTPVRGCRGEEMLVIEGEDAAGAPLTWIVTAAGEGRMTLEAVEGESRLDLLAVAPADRILARLVELAERVRVDA